MPYSDFTVKKVQEVFQVQLYETTGLFSGLPQKEASSHLLETLKGNVPLAASINTEKARSELIIAPILVEIKKQHKGDLSLFSGVELTVDRDKDLNGFCDFLLSRSSEQLYVRSPIVMIVEAKNENIMSGLGQCIAEMIAAGIFNEREGESIDKSYGVITSGNLWRFLKLKGQDVHIDLDDYGIKELREILGILSAMVELKA
ncbi:hypothetical protein VU01_102310 [Candidatus Electrothrix marina]|uniref:Uncharacterized protein n=2 Tax=Candidatus Electrothrix marina TaxID=1859130 RepID=A0A3S3R3A1_9BACT|nr:hypothetical protein VT99_10225 [Candidatus Electrothrix marina]RWX52275.1 hypothetical protein VU01_102310 [Candidatus Electrothrix marina]